MVEVVGAGATGLHSSEAWPPDSGADSVEEDPRFGFEGQPKPATVASRLCSMGETVARIGSIQNQKLRTHMNAEQKNNSNKRVTEFTENKLTDHESKSEMPESLPC